MPAVLGRGHVEKWVELKVEGMTCAACSGAVEKALKQVNGVEQVEVNLLRARAQVSYAEPTTTAEELVDEIESIGFDASILNVTTAEPVASVPPTRRIELSVEGMTCAACSGAVERALRNAHSGVLDVQVSLLRSKAVIRCSKEAPAAESFAEEVEDCGFEAKVISESDEVNGAQRLQPESAKLHLSAHSVTDANLAQDKLEKMVGIINVMMFKTCCLRVSYHPDQVTPLEILKSLTNVEHLATAAEPETGSATASLRGDLRCALPPTLLIFALVFLLPLTGARFLQFDCGIPGLRAETLLLFALATPVQCYAGRRFHRAARRALERKSPNMDVLISTATCLAYGYSTFMMLLSVAFTFLGEVQEGPPPHFFETPCSLITVVLIGRLLEAAAKQRTTDSLDELVRASPSNARVNGKEIPTELVALGDLVEIFPGEVAPVDGELVGWTEGSDAAPVGAWSTAAVVAFDESLLTGESRPVPKHLHETVIGCSRHVGSQACRIRATRVGSGSAVNQIVQLVERAAATASTAPAQRFADAAAKIFVPSVMTLAALTALVWFCMVSSGSVHMPFAKHHGSAFLTCEHMLFALKFGLSVLLVACPCAMGLATPTAVMVSTGVAARRGVLIKSAEAMELTAKKGVIIMDKTGTLTLGRPGMVALAVRSSASSTPVAQQISQMARSLASDRTKSSGRPITVVQLDRRSARALPTSQESDEMLGLCILLAASASHSEHPLSRGCEEGAAMLARCESPAVLLQNVPEVSDFEVLLGIGVKFKMGDLNVSVGYLEELSSELDDVMDWAQDQRSRGCTIVAVQANGVLLGLAALRDALHSNSWQVIQELQDAGEEVWMCTGDHSTTATAVAEELGIHPENVRAECLPAHKAALVSELQAMKKRVIFVGDGVNDAVALTSSEVGIAIGAGARLALDSADVVLVRADLQELLTVKQLALATVWCIKRNFLWAFFFNLCMIPLAAGVLQPRGIHLPPAAAAAAMACSSIMVVSSSLLLRRFQPRATGLRSHGAGREDLAPRHSRKQAQKKQIEMRPLTACDESPHLDGDGAV